MKRRIAIAIVLSNEVFLHYECFNGYNNPRDCDINPGYDINYPLFVSNNWITGQKLRDRQASISVVFNPFLENSISQKVQSTLASYQTDFYANLSINSPNVDKYCKQINSAKVLLQNYIALGMQRSLRENDYLRSSVFGRQSLLNGDDILKPYTDKLLGRIDLQEFPITTEMRRQALYNEIAAIFNRIDSNQFVETNPTVDVTLTKLDYRRKAIQALAVADFYTARTGTSLNVPVGGVLANDAKPFPSDTGLRAILLDGSQDRPKHGTVTWPTSQDGSFTYQSTPGYVGLDTFNYKAWDGSVESLKATVTIRVGDYGDLNGDGKIDTVDISLLMSLIGKNIPAAMLEKADINGDGVVNSLDSKALVWMCTKPKCVR